MSRDEWDVFTPSNAAELIAMQRIKDAAQANGTPVQALATTSWVVDRVEGPVLRRIELSSDETRSRAISLYILVQSSAARIADQIRAAVADIAENVSRGTLDAAQVTSRLLELQSSVALNAEGLQAAVLAAFESKDHEVVLAAIAGLEGAE